jgi:hypothetical protein
MACGHELWHYTHRCDAETRPRSQCGQQKQQQHLDGTVRSRFIDDTCADCDPGVRRKMLRAAYEQERVRMVERYREARAAGDEELMARLEYQMTGAVDEMRRANFEVGRGLLWSDGHVKWERRTSLGDCREWRSPSSYPN